jgi:hypothetical protein
MNRNLFWMKKILSLSIWLIIHDFIQKEKIKLNSEGLKIIAVFNDQLWVKGRISESFEWIHVSFVTPFQ